MDRQTVNGSVGSVPLRDLVAVAVALSCLVWCGPVIQAGGYGGYVVALLLGAVVPFVVALVSAQRPVLCGALVATCIVLSTLAHHPRFRTGLTEARSWDGFWERDAETWALVWAVQLGLALGVTVPLALLREPIRDGTRPTGT